MLISQIMWCLIHLDSMLSLECFDFKAQNGVTLGCAYQCPDQKSLSGCEMLVVGAGILTTMIMAIDDADLTFLMFFHVFPMWIDFLNVKKAQRWTCEKRFRIPKETHAGTLQQDPPCKSHTSMMVWFRPPCSPTAITLIALFDNLRLHLNIGKVWYTRGQVPTKLLWWSKIHTTKHGQTFKEFWWKIIAFTP